MSWQCTSCLSVNPTSADDRCTNPVCHKRYDVVGLAIGATRRLSLATRTLSGSSSAAPVSPPPTLGSLSSECSLSPEHPLGPAWLCVSCGGCNAAGARVCANGDCRLAFEVSGVVQTREGQRPRRGEAPHREASSSSTSSENGDSDDASPPPPRPVRLSLKRGREGEAGAAAPPAPAPLPLERKPRAGGGGAAVAASTSASAAAGPPRASLSLRIVKPDSSVAFTEYLTSPEPPPREKEDAAAAQAAGLFKRPPGRAPKGTAWDSTCGQWVPEDTFTAFTGAWARRAKPAADGTGGCVAKFTQDGERYMVTLHHSCHTRAAPRIMLKQLERICQQTLPNLPTGLISPLLHHDNSSHLFLTDGGGKVVAALTFRLVTLHHEGTREPSDATIEQVLCDVVLLVVAPDAQCRGHGSRLLQHARVQLREAAARCGGAAHTLLVQADDTAAAFWRKQGFRASAAARELVGELYAWRAAENPKFWGATPMIAIEKSKARRTVSAGSADDDDAPLRTPLSV